MKIYNTEDYHEFPPEVAEAFGDSQDGVEIAANLNAIGYDVLDLGLDGHFTQFTKRLTPADEQAIKDAAREMADGAEFKSILAALFRGDIPW